MNRDRGIYIYIYEKREKLLLVIIKIIRIITNYYSELVKRSLVIL